MNPADARKGADIWLLAATFVIAVAGLIYELIAATASSYLIGDSITQFSLVIGVFLSSMGLGAWASRHVRDAAGGFIAAQIALGLVGGFSAPIMFAAYAALGAVQVVMFALLILIGALVGMEIPLIARLLERAGARHRFENVLTVDYIGALAASLMFPLLIVPQVGLMTASLVFGVLNLLVAALSVWLFWPPRRIGALAVIGAALIACGLGLWRAEATASALDASLYEDDIVLTEQTPYQRITITRFRERVRLFLNGAIQFDSLDEHRYHEALVHPVMVAARSRARVLILGGGDGMAAREVLRYGDVERITLVDLDPRVTELFRDSDDLAALNDAALRDPRVDIVNRDAWAFAQEEGDLFDVVIADLPDPRTPQLSKLYSREFYAMMAALIRPGGAMATQAGSPVFARKAFWSVTATIEQAPGPGGPERPPVVTPYHVYVPSFGDWGFVMASARAPADFTPPFETAFLTQDVWIAAQAFGADAGRVPVDVNSIRDHPLVRYYEAGWDHWFR